MRGRIAAQCVGDRRTTSVGGIDGFNSFTPALIQAVHHFVSDFRVALDHRFAGVGIDHIAGKKRPKR